MSNTHKCKKKYVLIPLLFIILIKLKYLLNYKHI